MEGQYKYIYLSSLNALQYQKQRKEKKMILTITIDSFSVRVSYASYSAFVLYIRISNMCTSALTCFLCHFFPAMFSFPTSLFHTIMIANLRSIVGLEDVILNVTVLRDIYQGSIQSWDHPALVELNPGEG